MNDHWSVIGYRLPEAAARSLALEWRRRGNKTARAKCKGKANWIVLARLSGAVVRKHHGRGIPTSA